MLWNFDKFGIDELRIDKFEFDKLGLRANICFYKVKAIYPFITATLSDIFIFKIILCRQ
jgi:hypothetical protein